MTETNGLRNILNTAGTVHSLPEPPDPAGFPTREDYDEAYMAWYWETVAWKSSSKSTKESENTDADR